MPTRGCSSPPVGRAGAVACGTAQAPCCPRLRVRVLCVCVHARRAGQGTSPLSEAKFLTQRPPACGCSLQSTDQTDEDKVSPGPSSKLGCFVSVKMQLFFSGVCGDCSASGRCMKASTSIQHPFSPRQTRSDFNKSKSHTV